MPALAAVKLSTLTMALEYETLRVGKWRTLDRDRLREAQESLTYLGELETKLNSAIRQRFSRESETISTSCGTASCTIKYRIYVLDHATSPSRRIWQSGVLTHSGIAPDPSQDVAYKDAVATADNQIAIAKTEMRDSYLNSEYLSIKAKLRVHLNQPASTLFHIRAPLCNSGQRVILRPITQDLAVTAVNGPVDASPLALSGTLAQAQANDGSQFEMIRYGSLFLFQGRDSDLTVNVWGGSIAGKQLKLHGDRSYAQDHPNSLFAAYLNASDELILKVSDKDLTVGLPQGPVAGSTLALNKSLRAAESDANSRFRFSCFPV